MSHELQSADAYDATTTGKVLLSVLEKDCNTYKSVEEVQEHTDQMLASMRARHPDLTNAEILRKAIEQRAAVAAVVKFEHDAIERALQGDGTEETAAFLNEHHASVQESSQRLLAAKNAAKCRQCEQSRKTTWMAVDCGHSFCAGCIVRILDRDGRCGVCQEEIAWPPAQNFQLKDAMIEANRRGGETEQGEGSKSDTVLQAFERFSARRERGRRAIGQDEVLE